MTNPLEVLILDDEHEAADLMAEILAVYFPDAKFQVAYTGEDAVRMSADRQPGIAIMDLEMPGMGGEAAAHALRSTCLDGSLLLVALSGNVLRLAALREKGPFNHLFSKPVDFAAVVDLLRRHAEHV